MEKRAASLSMWTEPLTKPIDAPRIHILAFGVYVLCMLAYMVWVAYDFINYERPTLFESQETGASLGAQTRVANTPCAFYRHGIASSRMLQIASPPSRSTFPSTARTAVASLTAHTTTRCGRFHGTTRRCRRVVPPGRLPSSRTHCATFAGSRTCRQLNRRASTCRCPLRAAPRHFASRSPTRFRMGPCLR